jgi:hypothetical protein
MRLKADALSEPDSVLTHDSEAFFTSVLQAFLRTENSAHFWIKPNMLVRGSESGIHKSLRRAA